MGLAHVGSRSLVARCSADSHPWLGGALPAACRSRRCAACSGGSESESCMALGPLTDRRMPSVPARLRLGSRSVGPLCGLFVARAWLCLQRPAWFRPAPRRCTSTAGKHGCPFRLRPKVIERWSPRGTRGPSATRHALLQNSGWSRWSSRGSACCPRPSATMPGPTISPRQGFSLPRHFQCTSTVGAHTCRCRSPPKVTPPRACASQPAALVATQRQLGRANRGSALRSGGFCWFAQSSGCGRS